MVIIHTNDGAIQGEIRNSDYGDRYYSFRGIPYAEPPVGELKFKAPKPVKPWRGVRCAKQLGSMSYQRNLFQNGTICGSEDCLYLNVYTPHIKPKAPLPVMVFIHGGAFKNGSGDDGFFGPELLIRNDVILVTLNYRLGLLGFLCLETEDVPGNAGMKDQVLALKWVKNNIHHFGGDDKNITIFGESAGGASISFHLVSPMTKGLFRRAIAQSGSLLNFWATAFEPREQALAYARRFGFHSNDDKELYEFFKDQPLENLLDLNISTLLTNDNYDIPFSVVSEKNFENNEVFFQGNKYDVIRHGVHDGVDIMTGYTEDEGILAFAMAALKGSIDDLFKTADEFVQFFAPREISMVCPLKDQFEIGKMLKKHHLKNSLTAKENIGGLLKYLNLDFFVYGIITSARFYSNRNSVYLYKFTCKSERNQYAKIFHVASLIPERTVVCHADDLPYLFPAKALGQAIDQDSHTFKCINNVTKLWTNFAKYGNPTPDDSLDITWEPYDQIEQKFLEIGNELVPGTYPDREDVELWDYIFRKYVPQYNP